MSKITFRAEEDLVDHLESFDASKSEVLREALRAYVENADDRNDAFTRAPAGPSERSEDAGERTSMSLEELVAVRVDGIVSDRLDDAIEALHDRDVNVTVRLAGLEGSKPDDHVVVASDSGQTPPVEGDRKTLPADRKPDDGTTSDCVSCGGELSAGHAFCQNCGEKASKRPKCECGTRIQSDWAFCPGCGDRTTAADVLETG